MMLTRKKIGPVGPRAQNPRWRTELVGGHTNFASFHRRTKILVPKYMFSSVFEVKKSNESVAKTIRAVF